MDADVIVVGAGAAGLWAAATAARAGRRVLVLEKTPRAGTKVLASGGTRCNLTTTLGPREAARLFGAAERFVTPALRALPPAAVVARFHALGVPTVTEPELEKVFPASQRAVDVRDALLRDAIAAGATFRYGAAVEGIEPLAGGFTVTAGPGGPAGSRPPPLGHDGRAVDGWAAEAEEPATGAGDRVNGTRAFRCRKLLLCPGGRSYPRTGTTGDGYGWLAGLGLAIVPPVPALVPLTSDAAWVHELTGLSLQRVEARLLDPSDRLVARRARPVVFTHHGLSGPGAMDLSVHVARAALAGSAAGWTVALDLLPDRDLDGLRAELLDAAGRPGGPRLARVVGEGIPARLLAAVARQAGLEENPPLHRVDRKRRNRLVDALKGLRVPVSGTLGWDKAEVTGGGLHLDEVDPATLEVRSRPGLYAFGEILDLTGPIGGLNFQAAFATGELAGRHAAR